MTGRSAGNRMAGSSEHAGRLPDRIDVVPRATRAQAALLCTVFARFPEGIAFLDPDFVFLAANEAFADQIGLPLEWVIGRTVGEVMAGWVEQVENICREVRDTGKSSRAEAYPHVSQLQPERDATYWDTTVAPIFGDSDGFTGYLLQHREVTERKRAEQAQERVMAEVRRYATELEALIDSTAEGVIIADHEGKILWINQAGRDILGIPNSETAPKTIAQITETNVLSPDDRPLPKIDWPMMRALRGERFAQQEMIWVKPDGSHCNLLFAGSTLYDETGRPVLGVNTFRDITQIRQGERQREEFISVVAHDLRGAMTTIRGYADLLTRLATTQALPESVLGALDTISSRSHQLERMIADLVDGSRIEVRQLTLIKEPVDIHSLVKDIVQRSSELMLGHPVRVEVRGQVPPVDVDPDRVEQIVVNLLSNAGKYSYPNSEITVEIEPRPKEVVISVTNLGQGIFPEDKERIFTRFNRTRQATERKTQGLGLGLYIAKGLIEAHSGRIWVESEPGKHATFRFTLPLP